MGGGGRSPPLPFVQLGYAATGYTATTLADFAIHLSYAIGRLAACVAASAAGIYTSLTSYGPAFAACITSVAAPGSDTPCAIACFASATTACSTS
jgi:hypothetical protein